MKKVIKNKSIVLLGSLAGTCLLATVALANPALAPEHPGYPMKESKSPVNGVSTANDPRQENFSGQKAQNAATKGGDENMKLPRQTTGQVKGGNASETQNQMGQGDQGMGQEHMTRQNPSGDQKQPGQNQTDGQSQIKSQSRMNVGEQDMNIGEQIDRQDEELQGPRDSKLEGY